MTSELEVVILRCLAPTCQNSALDARSRDPGGIFPWGDIGEPMLEMCI